MHVRNWPSKAEVTAVELPSWKVGDRVWGAWGAGTVTAAWESLVSVQWDSGIQDLTGWPANSLGPL